MPSKLTASISYGSRKRIWCIEQCSVVLLSHTKPEHGSICARLSRALEATNDAPHKSRRTVWVMKMLSLLRSFLLSLRSFRCLHFSESLHLNSTLCGCISRTIADCELGSALWFRFRFRFHKNRQQNYYPIKDCRALKPSQIVKWKL